jgi:FkbM family methyltransferase
MSLPLFLSWLQPVDFPRKLGICELLFGTAIAPKKICWVQTGAGLAWKLDLANPTHRWIVYGKYEGAAFLNWAKNYLPNNGIVIDSGASIGQMLMYLAQYVPQGKVLAFEPGQEASNWLQECLAANSQLPVELIRAGLGKESTQLKLRPMGDAHQHGAQSQISETDGESIKIVKLADELEARGIKTIDLWALDVEGYEVPALQGVEDWLKEKRIKALYVEISGDNSQKVRDYLSLLGYQCYLFKPNGTLHQPSKFPGHTNGLFLPN